ncbi:MAG: hypothetical protein ACI8ZB_001002 [Desulforhopalus sp.]
MTALGFNSKYQGQFLTDTTVMLLTRNANTLIARQKAEYNQNKLMQIIENQSIGLSIVQFIKTGKIHSQFPRWSYLTLVTFTMDIKC